MLNNNNKTKFAKLKNLLHCYNVTQLEGDLEAVDWKFEHHTFFHKVISGKSNNIQKKLCFLLSI